MFDRRNNRFTNMLYLEYDSLFLDRKKILAIKALPTRQERDIFYFLDDKYGTFTHHDLEIKIHNI